MCSAIAFIWLLLLPTAGDNFSFNAVPYEPCSRTKIVSVSMSPCLYMPHVFGDKLACFLVHGTKVTIEILFFAPFKSEALETAFFTTFLQYTIPTPESKVDACFLKSKLCPVRKSDILKLQYEFHVLKYYPLGQMFLDIAVIDKKRKKPLVCVSILVLVTKNNKLSYD